MLFWSWAQYLWQCPGWTRGKRALTLVGGASWVSPDPFSTHKSGVWWKPEPGEVEGNHSFHQSWMSFLHPSASTGQSLFSPFSRATITWWWNTITCYVTNVTTTSAAQVLLHASCRTKGNPQSLRPQESATPWNWSRAMAEPPSWHVSPHRKHDNAYRYIQHQKTICIMHYALSIYLSNYLSYLILSNLILSNPILTYLI